MSTHQNEDLLRYAHTANMNENIMYIFGGANASRKSTNQLWSLDMGINYSFTKLNTLESVTWTHHESTGEVPRKLTILKLSIF